ncbi:uncharacterized protein LOC127850238 [Dreissena polymorpha]|nr:uncharacterized protein LOC127850238 [Dreissena polymorpha]
MRSPHRTLEDLRDVERMEKDVFVSEKGTESLPCSNVDTDAETVNRNGIKQKKKRSSWEYQELTRPKKRKQTFCVCDRPDDGRLYWMCDHCKDWVHPECIKRDHADCPKPFCAHHDVHIRKWEVTDSAEKCGFEESDGPEDVERFLITLDVAVKVVPVAYKTCFSIVTSTVEDSDVLWLQNHCTFITNVDAAPKSSIGYGFGVFTLEALTVVEKNIQDTFSENGNHPLVKLVANEKLKSAFKKNKRLVSSYTESVLVKEACSVIMQEATGCSYKEATEALQRTVAKSIFTAYSLATTHRSSITEYWSSALADRRKAW